MPKGGGRNTIGIKYDVDGSRRPEREREREREREVDKLARVSHRFGEVLCVNCVRDKIY